MLFPQTRIKLCWCVNEISRTQINWRACRYLSHLFSSVCNFCYPVVWTFFFTVSLIDLLPPLLFNIQTSANVIMHYSHNKNKLLFYKILYNIFPQQKNWLNFPYKFSWMCKTKVTCFQIQNNFLLLWSISVLLIWLFENSFGMQNKHLG